MLNKEFVKKSQEILKELGYEIPVGHLYELYSKLSGYKSWNVAVTKQVAFVEQVLDEPTTTFAPLSNGANGNSLYTIRLTQETQEMEIKKMYMVQAKDEKEARAIMTEYINVQGGDIEPDQIKYEQTKKLLEQEDSYSFMLKNWELIDNSYIPTITEVYKTPSRF